MLKVSLIIIVLIIVFPVTVLSCGNTSDNVETSATLKFVLIPHEPGEAPMVPHPKLAFDECPICHIDTSGIGSSIKIEDVHACDECHLNLEYDGPCQETTPAKYTCIFDVCHRYP